MRISAILVMTIFATLPFLVQAEPYDGEISVASLKLAGPEMTFETVDGLKGSLQCRTELHFNGRAVRLRFKIENSQELSLEYDSERLQIELESGALHQFDFTSEAISCADTLVELKFDIARAGRARVLASKLQRLNTPDGPRKIWISTRKKPQ